MSTFRLPILGPMTRPMDAGHVYWAKNSLGGTNVEEFAIFFPLPTGADVQLTGNFFVPKNYGTTNKPKIVLVWLADDFTPTGSIGWEYKYMAVADGESYNASFVETLTVLTANPTPWLTREESSMELGAAANVAVDENIRWTLSRDDSTDTADDGNVRLTGAFFEYQDT